MTEQDQKQLGTTLWGIADQLRGAYANLSEILTGSQNPKKWRPCHG